MPNIFFPLCVLLCSVPADRLNLLCETKHMTEGKCDLICCGTDGVRATGLKIPLVTHQMTATP